MEHLEGGMHGSGGGGDISHEFNPLLPQVFFSSNFGIQPKIGS